jgi:hypothetical protein
MLNIRTRIPFWVRRTFGFRCKNDKSHGRMKLMALDSEGGREVWGCEICNAERMIDRSSVVVVYTKPPTEV